MKNSNHSAFVVQISNTFILLTSSNYTVQSALSDTSTTLLPLMAEPAPYGGFMTRTIDAEKEQEEKLKQQQVEIQINGVSQTLRPEALHIHGVDNLSTEDLQAFVDYYLNFEKVGDNEYREFESPIWFRVQWIDDLNVNLVFKTHEHAAEALRALSISGGPSDNEIKEFSQEYVSSIVQERETKPYAASISFHKYQKELQKQSEEKDLFEDKKPKEEVHENGMDEDDSSVVLYIRQSFQSDRKVKNAAAYSRYYLLHGEPDRTQRQSTARPERNGRDRGGYAREEEETDDLFADKLESIKSRREEEDDLFAWRLREQSPGRENRRGGRGGRGGRRRGRGRR